MLAELGTVEKAAKKANYTERKGYEILDNPKAISYYFDYLSASVATTDKAMKGLEKLAFGGTGAVGDLLAGKLCQEDLDLFNVSKIRCKEDDVEVTFADRQKALEKLLEYTTQRDSQQEKGGLVQALERSAKAIRDKEEKEIGD